jgi:ribosomal protein S26
MEAGIDVQLPSSSSSSSFLSKSYCSENLEFYDAVDQFRHLWRSSGTASMTDDQRRAMADGVQHIWNHYVAPVPHVHSSPRACWCVRCAHLWALQSAMMQINIDSDVVEAIQSQLGTPCAYAPTELRRVVLCVLFCFVLVCHVRRVHSGAPEERTSLNGCARAARVCAGRCLMKPRTP